MKALVNAIIYAIWYACSRVKKGSPKSTEQMIEEMSREDLVGRASEALGSDLDGHAWFGQVFLNAAEWHNEENPDEERIGQGEARREFERWAETNFLSDYPEWVKEYCRHVIREYVSGELAEKVRKRRKAWGLEGGDGQSS